MASLHNDKKSLRFRLSLADRELPQRLPGQPAPDPKSGRLLGDLGIEHFDRRDKTYWPFVHQAVFWMALPDCEGLLRNLESIIRGELAGFAFRSTLVDDLGLQIGKQEGRYSVEVGLDLNTYLTDTAGSFGAPGDALALFRFTTNQTEMVAFAHELKTELARVLETDHGQAP